MALSVLDSARWYHGLGWSIIPIRNGTKKPAVPWKKYQSERADLDQLKCWFEQDGHTSLAVVLGAVSGNLVCRDFDCLSAFDAWYAEHAEVAKSLPMVNTPRPGRHVYVRCMSQLPTEHQGVGLGEFRAEGAYCLLPPSLNANGKSYEWLKPPGTAIPIVDPVQLGLLSVRHSRHSQLMSLKEDSAVSAVTTAPTVSQEAIQHAICLTLPDGPGQRNAKIFEFARQLKAIPELCGLAAFDLKSHMRLWHAAATPFIKTKAWEESWSDFQNAWSRARIPAGESSFEQLLKNVKSLSIPPCAEEYDQLEVHCLVALCRESQRLVGDAAFFLGARTAGDALGVDKSSAARWLKMLCEDRVLRLVQPGTLNSHQASEYRYIAADLQEVGTASS
jgi:hypothetical protein